MPLGINGRFDIRGKIAYYSGMKPIKYKRQIICDQCGYGAKVFKHLKNSGPGAHTFEPRLETEVEAAYRQGYEKGYYDAEDKAHWGSGW